MILRRVKCDVKGCSAEYSETGHGDGFPGWGQLTGLSLNGQDNPMMCPEHLADVANFVDRLEVNAQ